jgi:hypothetical protein
VLEISGARAEEDWGWSGSDQIIRKPHCFIGVIVVHHWEDPGAQKNIVATGQREV